jgi:hypothetical protein
MSLLRLSTTFYFIFFKNKSRRKKRILPCQLLILPTLEDYRRTRSGSDSLGCVSSIRRNHKEQLEAKKPRCFIYMTIYWNILFCTAIHESARKMRSDGCCYISCCGFYIYNVGECWELSCWLATVLLVHLFTLVVGPLVHHHPENVVELYSLMLCVCVFPLVIFFLYITILLGSDGCWPRAVLVDISLHIWK